MSELDAVLLACLLFSGAALYASVGQSGATAFIAAMGIIGLPATTIRPTVLALNILAASFSTWRFHRAGLVTWSRLRRFALASAPSSFVGGAIALPDLIYRPVIGIVLLIAALLLFRRATTGGRATADASRPAAMPLELLTGSMIGLLAGLTATGGGVFLSPVVILLGWVSPRQAAGLASPFILVNSIAGLAGAACLTPQSVMPEFPTYAAITVAGTVLGATLGIRYLRATWCQIVLGIALSLSGIRLVAS